MSSLEVLPYTEKAQQILDTPAYVYSEKRIQKLCDAFSQSIKGVEGIHLHFSIKSNNNPHFLKYLKSRGWGIDGVSAGELKFATKLGFQSEDLVFSGVGKTREEIKWALQNSVGMISAESEGELKRIAEIASELNLVASVAIRFNPHIEVKTHPYIATGMWEHKFGVDEESAFELYSWAQKQDSLNLKGITMHIGSQLFDLEVMQEAMDHCLAFTERLKNKGIALDVLDVGGGLGVYYEDPLRLPEFEKYGALLKRSYDLWIKQQGARPELKIFSECGRALSAQSGFLVTRVLGTKSNKEKNFAIVDASMTELIRPALYKAEHPIELWSDSRTQKMLSYDIVGPVCESSDVLAAARNFPELQEGDLLLISCAGAYAYTMASFYNYRRIAPEYWVDLEGNYHLSRKPIEPPGLE